MNTKYRITAGATHRVRNRPRLLLLRIGNPLLSGHIAEVKQAAASRNTRRRPRITDYAVFDAGLSP